MSRRIKPKRVPGRESEEVRERDPDGRIVVHHRTVDTLGKMLRSGTIDVAMHGAAKDFQAAFIVAQLDPTRAVPTLRVPGNGSRARTERAAARPTAGARGDGGAGPDLEPGGELRLARRRPAAEHSRVGDASRMGRPAGAAGAGAGHADRGVGHVGRHFGYGEARRASYTNTPG